MIFTKCMHYPKKMLQHLEEVRKIAVRKVENGIYYLEGDAIKMQLLISRELSTKDNYWLQHLQGDLKAGEELESLLENYERQKQSKWHQAVMDLIVRANWDQVKEEKEMCEALKELFADEIQESIELQLISKICIKLKKKKTVSEISEELEEPVEKVEAVCQAALSCAPDYDENRIYEMLKEKEEKGQKSEN